MVTVSNVVKKIVNSRPMLYEALANNIVNFANLAENLKPEIEKEMGKVTEASIVMAIRRYAEGIEGKGKEVKFKFNSEISMKTGLADVTFVKTPALLAKLRDVYGLVDYDRGETLNIIQGNYEVTIVISEKHLAGLKKILKSEKVINTEKNLVALAMSFSKDFLYTPGILAKVIRKLYWENVNVYENISTMTELIFIVSAKDAICAYNALEALVGE